MSNGSLWWVKEPKLDVLSSLTGKVHPELSGQSAVDGWLVASL